MDRDLIFILGIMLSVLVIFSISLIGAHELNGTSIDDCDKTILNVSSEGHIELYKITEDIKNNSFYKGYNKTTLKWMESLADKYVYMSSDEIVIMDKWEADKIPSEFEVCDAYLQEIISCNVLENRSLDTQFKKDVLLIEDVEFIREEVYSAWSA